MLKFVTKVFAFIKPPFLGVFPILITTFASSKQMVSDSMSHLIIYIE